VFTNHLVPETAPEQSTYLPTYAIETILLATNNRRNLPHHRAFPSKPHSPIPYITSAQQTRPPPHPCTQHSPQDYASRAARPHTTRTSARSCVQTNHAANHRPHRTSPGKEPP
jgi:hypothetical protein